MVQIIKEDKVVIIVHWGTPPLSGNESVSDEENLRLLAAGTFRCFGTLGCFQCGDVAVYMLLCTL